MKTWMLIPVGAGVALLGYGLLQGSPVPKALKPLGAPPAAPGVLPKHDPGTIPRQTQGQTTADASYCQLLTAYRQDLRRYKTQRDDAKLRMQEALREAQQVCDEFAWNASWKYVYAGFFGVDGKTEFHKEKSNALKTRCVEYEKGAVRDPGKPTIPAPPSKGAYWYDGTYTDVAQKINDLKHQVDGARAALPGIRDKYLRAKAEHDRAAAKVAELEKKIADLEAQGVFC